MTTLKPQQRSTHVLEHARRRIMGSLLCTQKMLATAPQIARATLRRATPLAHPNAPSRALYGPGVARPHPQPRKRLSTCVLPTRSKASWDSFARKRKRCSQRQHLLGARQRRQLLGARHQPLAHPNALSRALHGPGVARPRTQSQPQKRHTRVLSSTRRRDASRDPFARKRCVLETCGTSKLLAERPTSRPAKSIILSVTRVVSGATTHTCTETLRMLTLAPPKRLPGPLCTQNVLTTYGTSESARISCPSKCIISSVAPVLSGVLMHTPVGTLRTRALAMPKACREPFAVICWCSRWHLS
jgi:hypothetical protein